MALEGSVVLRILIALGVVGLFGVVTFALAAATLGTVINRHNGVDDQVQVLSKQMEDLAVKVNAIYNNLPTTTVATTTAARSTTTSTAGSTTTSTSRESAATTDNSVTTDFTTSN